jgi:hypothetical protein
MLTISQHLHAQLNEDQWKTIFNFSFSQLTNQPDNLLNYYKARLMGVFLSAMYLEPILTIRYLIQQQKLEVLVNLIINKSAYFICDYDRKLLVLGLSSLFSVKFSEKQLDDLALKCLECSILTLHIQRIEQNKIAGFYKSRVIKTSDETDELKLYSAIQDKFRQMAQMTEEDYEDDDEFGTDPEEEGDKEEMEVLKALMSNKGKASIALKSFNTEVLKANEFEYFVGILRHMKVGLSYLGSLGPRKLQPGDQQPQ